MGARELGLTWWRVEERERARELGLTWWRAEVREWRARELGLTQTRQRGGGSNDDSV